MRSFVSRMFAPGCRRTMIRHGALAVHPGGHTIVLDVVENVCDVTEAHGRAILIRDDDLAKCGRPKELSVPADGVRLGVADEEALRLVRSGRGDGLAHILESEPHIAQGHRVYLDPDGGLLASPDVDLPNASYLRDFSAKIVLA